MTRQKFDKKTIATITDLGRRFSDATITMHEAIAKGAGLSGTDHKYLAIIMRNGPMTAGELAKITGLTTGAITGVIDRLEKKELVSRAFDNADRRKIVIVPHHDNITKLLGGVFAGLQQKITALLSTKTNVEMQIIEKYLVEVIEVMHDLTNTLQTGEAK